MSDEKDTAAERETARPIETGLVTLKTPFLGPDCRTYDGVFGPFAFSAGDSLLQVGPVTIPVANVAGVFFCEGCAESPRVWTCGEDDF